MENEERIKFLEQEVRRIFAIDAPKPHEKRLYDKYLKEWKKLTNWNTDDMIGVPPKDNYPSFYEALNISSKLTLEQCIEENLK